ncbi:MULTISPECIES: membrane protein insertase YidC [Gammaproteobacteria]|uniref:membrane protein insertase YidC n=1 Tax=Gammaproteobacteria TaxID=1236 RepID=UPI000DD02A8E|nr:MULTISPECIES: membrane protein insertase YidC [Gammaproteobacteria]RTE86688.1 membrane protein insertase YidC [Aliidiomarina sp. B3213]TCZ90758.1 membrane protein insertase YidC [Lysobacter sp. N42]
MDSRRTILVILLLVLSFFMYQQWLLEDPSNTPGVNASNPAAQNTQTVAQTTSGNAEFSVPEAGSQSSTLPVADASGTPEASETNNSDTVVIRTDVFEIEIALRGGDIVRSELLEHARTLGEQERYTILFQDPGHVHIAQSGLIGPNGIDRADNRPLYQASQREYVMNGEDRFVVPLTYVTENGVEVTKTFTFNRGDYAIEVAHQVRNTTGGDIQMAPYGQLKQTVANADSGSMFMPTYRGAAYSSSDERYEKYSFKDIEKRNLSRQTEAGWIAMLEHYFVTAWVPNQQANNRLYTTNLANSGNALIGYVGPTQTIAAGATETFESSIYMGPKNQDRLAELAQHLNLTVDYGFLWWLAQPIHWLLSFLHSFVGNWGFAIILVTLVVKGALYPLTKAQYTSMAKMRKIAPRMQELKERFGDDRQKMSQAMMKMYKDEKVNPLGGCLPMLLQLPIFLALYWVLLESPEIRHADFMLWINDLSSKDPYYILPVLMGASMFLMQRLQPTPMTDPMQQKIMQLMPIMFTVFFLFFPAGLVLYWLVSNLISISQMLWIYRQLDKKGLGTKKA